MLLYHVYIVGNFNNFNLITPQISVQCSTHQVCHVMRSTVAFINHEYNGLWIRIIKTWWLSGQLPGSTSWQIAKSQNS